MILFFYGEETYKSLKSVQQLKNKFLQKNPTGGGLIIFECDEECDLSKITQSFGEQNLFAQKKLIIIKNIFSNTKAPEQKEIIKKLEQDTEDVIVFLEEGDVRKNATLFKWIQNNAQKIQKSEKLENIKLENWIKKEVIKNKSDIDEKAIKELILFVGNDLWKLSQEIQKLTVFAHNKTITTKDIRIIVHSRIDANMFETIEAIIAQDKATALYLFKKQVAAGDSIFHIFSMYVYQVRTLLNVSSVIDTGITDNRDIATILKLHPFVVQKNITMTQKLSHKKIIKMHHELVKIDFDSKIGKCNIDVALELFIVNV